MKLLLLELTKFLQHNYGGGSLKLMGWGKCAIRPRQLDRNRSQLDQRKLRRLPSFDPPLTVNCCEDCNTTVWVSRILRRVCDFASDPRHPNLSAASLSIPVNKTNQLFPVDNNRRS